MIKVILIAAMSLNYVIGQNGHLVYNDSEDMQNFKNYTTGNIVVMGRKTWDSIPDKFKPLTNRLNIVISRNDKLKVPDSVLVFKSWNDVKDWIMANKPDLKVFVIGGGEIYKEAIVDADELIISQFKTVLPENEYTTYFPKINPESFKLRIQRYSNSKKFITNYYYNESK